MPEAAQARLLPQRERKALVNAVIQRVVRLHGKLFAREGLHVFEAGRAATQRALAALVAANAFGDLLLTKLLAIAVFSVECVAGAQHGAPLPSDVPRETDEAALSHALALAFGHASAVALRRGGGSGGAGNNSNSNSRPRGSRGLGPLGFFCDWLAERPHFARARRSAGAPERAQRAAFAEAVAALDLSGAAPPRTAAARVAALPEELELRSFLPVRALYEPRAASGEAVPDAEVAGMREAKVARWLSSSVASAEGGASAVAAAEEAEQPEPEPEPEEDEADDEDELDDELIVFQPAFGPVAAPAKATAEPPVAAAVAAPAPAPAFGGAFGWQQSSLFAGATLGAPALPVAQSSFMAAPFGVVAPSPPAAEEAPDARMAEAGAPRRPPPGLT